MVLTRPASAPAVMTSAAPAIAAVTSAEHVTDGIDPKAVGCTNDTIALDSAPVVLHQTAVLHGRQLPAGTQVGSVLLLFSPHCAGAWPRFEPIPGLNPDPTETGVGAITIEGDRPIDGTATIWKMGHIDQAYADLLLTGVGCVSARAQVDMVGQNASASGQTRCLPRP
jgi:hypothetical protein